MGPGIRYAVIEGGPNGAADVHTTADGTPDEAFEAVAHRYLLAEDLLPNYAKDLGYESPDCRPRAVQSTILGAELEGVSYDRLFDYYADAETWGTQNAWKILVDDYVTVSDGTGIVHQARPTVRTTSASRMPRVCRPSSRSTTAAASCRPSPTLRGSCGWRPTGPSSAC